MSTITSCLNYSTLNQSTAKMIKRTTSVTVLTRFALFAQAVLITTLTSTVQGDVIYNWSGTCDQSNTYGCQAPEKATGELRLTDNYPRGEPFTIVDFVSFTYKSSSGTWYFTKANIGSNGVRGCPSPCNDSGQYDFIVLRADNFGLQSYWYGTWKFGYNGDFPPPINRGSGWSLTLATINTPPTANAGPDQAIRAGSKVTLDGRGSFDDNTATDALRYAWTLTAWPGSNAPTLSGANTATPYFIADAAGTYVVSLIVTDGEGAASLPDTVEVSTNNLAPTAVATATPALAIIGSAVTFDGSGSTDPEGNPLTYQWAITGAPPGSGAALMNLTSPMASFVPDLPGLYTATLTVSDAIGSGDPASVEATATTAEGFAEVKVLEAGGIAERAIPSQVTTAGNQQALTNFLSQALVAMQAGTPESLIEARDKLTKALERVDGCTLHGAPDGNGPGRDWITNCTIQTQVYGQLKAALDALTP